MPSIDVIGRITGAAGGIDSTTSVGSDTLSQANNSAQLSAMGAGLFTAVAPLTAVTAGMVAADLQINKLIADHNQGASTNTQVADVITLIGDISIIGGGLSAYVGAAPVGELFGALGASADATGLALNHIDQITNAFNNLESQIDSANSDVLNSVGNYLSKSIDALNSIATAESPSSNPGTVLQSTENQTNSTIASNTNITALSATADDPASNPTVIWTDASGTTHAFISAQTATINASNEEIDVASGSSVTINGSNNHIQALGDSGTTVVVDGKENTIDGDNGSDIVNLLGDGTTATVNGGGTVGLINNQQTLTLGDSGSTVNTAPGVVNEVISGSGEGINLTANSAANIDGSGNTINLNTGDSIAVHGGGNTINGGADERIYVGNTDGNPDTLNVSNDRENSDAIDHQTTGIFFGPQTQASLNGTGDGYSSAPGDQITSPDDFMSDYEGNAPFDNGYYSGDDPSSAGQGDDPGGSDGSINPGSADGSDGSDGSINPGSADGSDGSTSPGNSDGSDGSINPGSADGSDGSDGSISPGSTDGSDGSIGADGGDDGGFFGGFGDPLILDLAHGGVQTVNADHSPARFDMGNDGRRVQTGWGTPGEGYLVDLPSGAQTPTDAADLVPTFEALRAADTNHDSVLDAHDAGWSNLKVWVDASGTAVSDPGSLHALGDLGIVSIDLNATPDGRLDHGNTILADGRFTWADGSRGDIADVALRFRTNPSPVSNGAAAIDPGTQTQASQLVAAMSTFGVSPAAESTVQTAPPSGQIALTVDPTAAQARRLAA